MMTLINNFYKQRKDEIEFIFIGGSSCLSYIENPDDFDIFVVYKEYPENIKDRVVDLVSLQTELRKMNPKVAVISQYVEVLRKWLDNSTEVNQKLERRATLPTYAYMCPSFNIVCGSDTVKIKKLNILNIKRRVKKAIKDYMPKITEFYENKGFLPKSLYHILTVLYIYQNNSYELTQEQIDNINLLHACQPSEELVNWIYNEVDKF